MAKEHVLKGRVRRTLGADWGPLDSLLGSELSDWFGWTGELELEDGTRAQAYFHIATERTLLLAADGQAFVAVDVDHFLKRSLSDALSAVLDGWHEPDVLSPLELRGAGVSGSDLPPAA